MLNLVSNTGLLSWLPVSVSTLLLAYLGVKIIDMILGLLKAWKNHNYRSSKMREGLVAWVAEMMAIVFVIGIDYILGLNFMLCGFTTALFIYKECGSVLENLAECGVELPGIVAEKLEVFNSKSKGDGRNE
jgi:toxin secretion/phage lysis holin